MATQALLYGKTLNLAHVGAFAALLRAGTKASLRKDVAFGEMRSAKDPQAPEFKIKSSGAEGGGYAYPHPKR